MRSNGSGGPKKGDGGGTKSGAGHSGSVIKPTSSDPKGPQTPAPDSTPAPESNSGHGGSVGPS